MSLTVEDRVVVFEVFPLLVPFWVFVQHDAHGFPEAKWTDVTQNEKNSVQQGNLNDIQNHQIKNSKKTQFGLVSRGPSLTVHLSFFCSILLYFIFLQCSVVWLVGDHMEPFFHQVLIFKSLNKRERCANVYICLRSVCWRFSQPKSPPMTFLSIKNVPSSVLIMNIKFLIKIPQPKCLKKPYFMSIWTTVSVIIGAEPLTPPPPWW